MGKQVFKVGIAGYGVVGKTRRKCIDSNPSLDLVAVCDRDFDDDLLIDGIWQYQSYKKLIDHDIDILMICLTNDVAPEVTIAGLQKGLHVFCEKPPGRKVADIKKVIEQEKKSQTFSMLTSNESKADKWMNAQHRQGRA